MAAVETISGYTHINILVDDLEAAHGFYIDALGFEVLPRPDFPGFDGAWYRVGQMQLHLSVVKEMPDLKGGFPHLAFHIPSDCFDETIDGLKSAGVDGFEALEEGDFKELPKMARRSKLPPYAEY